MANALDKDIDGKVVLIDDKYLKEEYSDEEKRAFFVIGGFGASPSTRGSALMGIFLHDADKCRMEGHYVDKEAGIVADSLDGYDGPVHEDVHKKLHSNV